MLSVAINLNVNIIAVSSSVFMPSLNSTSNTKILR